MNVLNDIARALSQLGDRRFLRVLGLGVGLTLALLACATLAFSWLAGWLVPDDLTILGYQIGFADDVASYATIGLMIVASVFLMVPVAAAFTGLFLEDVAAAVESRFYGHLPTAPGIPVSDALRDSLAFLGVVVAVNLVALVIYLMSGPFAPLVFWIVNGYLLGREYYQLVAMRRLGRAGAKASRRRHMPQIWLAGTLMAAPLTVPVLNLFVPVIGVAAFTHLFHRLDGSSTPVSRR